MGGLFGTLISKIFGGGGGGMMGGGGAAGGGGGMFSGLMGGGGGGEAAASQAIQIPYRPGMQPGAAASGGDGFWNKLGGFMQGEEGQGGSSPARALGHLGGAIDAHNTGPIQSVPHPVQNSGPNVNRGLFGLENLTTSANRGGWGR